jgi:hypothetical protein
MEQLVLDKFKRVNDKFAPDLIGQDELAVLTDAVLDYKIGKPVKRGHFSRYDAGIPAADKILKLVDVKDNAGIQKMLGAVGTIIRRYSPPDNAWDNYVLGLTSGFKFRHVPFSDKFIFTFDTDDDPIMGSNDLATYWNLELGTATVTAIQSYFKSGGLLTVDAQYKWIIMGLTEDGQLSPPSRPFTHYYHTGRYLTTHSTASMIYFQNLPYIADSRVKSRMLFRTKADGEFGLSGHKTGDIYYLAAILDNDYTGTNYQKSYIDNKPDDDLGTEIVIYLNTPTRAKYVAFSNERLFLGNFSQQDRNFYSFPSSDTGSRGTHTGANNAAVLTDSRQSWVTNLFVGKIIQNITDGSSGTITANTATTITATLGGGTENDWDTGDSYSITISGYSTGYGLSITDANTGAATLLANTQYDYRIHVVDEYERLSRYYHQIGTTTANDASNDHYLTIQGIGVFEKEFAKNLRVKIYRRTAGTGSYYLVFEGSLVDSTWTAGTASYSPETGQFIDYGAANLTETWTDPDTVKKTYSSAITFSEISSPSTIRDEDKRQIYPDDSEEITGLFDDQDGVIIFKTNSINKIFVSGNPINWRLVQLCKSYGSDQPDTIQKSGSSYYFIHRNRAYRYDYGAEKPVDIGWMFQGTLDLIQTWYDSTINDRWYCIQCKTATVSYTLVYDLKMETWYKFKRTQSASEDFKTIYFTKYGSSQELLSNSDNYISIYNELGDQPTATRADTEIGSTRQISPVVTSKNFKFSDGITLARLRKLKFDYTKVNAQDTSIIITDADTGTTIVLTDNTGSGLKLFEDGIGKATDTLKISRAFNVSVQGAGMERWDNLRIEYRPIRRGKAVSF